MKIIYLHHLQYLISGACLSGANIALPSGKRKPSEERMEEIENVLKNKKNCLNHTWLSKRGDEAEEGQLRIQDDGED